MECWSYNTFNVNARQLCMKILNERNKIKRWSIAYSYIWHVGISKCVYWLELRHILWKFGKGVSYQTQTPLIFLIFISDIGQCCRPSQIDSLENQKSDHVWIILNKNYIIINWWRLWARCRPLQRHTEFQKLPTNRHFLFLCLCLYMVYLSLGSFFQEVAKKWKPRFTYMTNW